jgi:hypothetical protein
MGEFRAGGGVPGGGALSPLTATAVVDDNGAVLNIILVIDKAEAPAAGLGLPPPPVV